MENEKKNRKLIDEKAYEDHLVPFVSSILEPSHYSFSLSHSWILRVFLEEFNIEPRKRKTSKGMARKGKEIKDQERKVMI